MHRLRLILAPRYDNTSHTWTQRTDRMQDLEIENHRLTEKETISRCSSMGNEDSLPIDRPWTNNELPMSIYEVGGCNAKSLRSFFRPECCGCTAIMPTSLR